MAPLERCADCDRLRATKIRHGRLLLTAVRETVIDGASAGVATHVCVACGTRWEFTDRSEWRLARIERPNTL